VRLAALFPQGDEPPYGGQSLAATDAIQWPGTWLRPVSYNSCSTAWCGPACQVVWEGPRGNPGPYPDQLFGDYLSTSGLRFRIINSDLTSLLDSKVDGRSPDGLPSAPRSEQMRSLPSSSL
jgi:hypothetical protein